MDVEPDVWSRFTDFLLFNKGLRDRSIYAYCNTLRNIRPLAKIFIPSH